VAVRHLDAVAMQILPDPTEALAFIAPAVVEILAGVRSVSQLGGVVTEDVYQRLRERSAAGARARFESGKREQWPTTKVSRVHREYTRNDLVQSVVVLNCGDRTRAVAIRLEGRNNRWLATAITVL